MISINIHATFYGGMKLPAKYVPNSETLSPLSSLRNMCVLSCQEWCHNYKRELGLPTNTQDKQRQSSHYWLIPANTVFSFWQERHIGKNNKLIIYSKKKKKKEKIECKNRCIIIRYFLTSLLKYLTILISLLIMTYMCEIFPVVTVCEKEVGILPLPVNL